MNNRILQDLIDRACKVKVITINGFPMVGRIADSDEEMIALQTADLCHNVYKHAISTVTEVRDEK